MIKNILLASLLFLSIKASAQIEKIDTDRPDQTESPFTVPKKWIQFESGFLRETEKDIYPSFRNWKDIHLQYPSLLSKYGLGKRVELRLITAFATYKYKEGNKITYKETGLESVQLGGKLNFLDEQGLRPKTSLIAHYDFGRLRKINYDTIDGVNFRFTMQHTLSKKLSLSYNAGIEWERFGHPPAYIYTLALGYNISEDWYGYVEAFGFIWKKDKPENSIDAGIAYYINDDFKIDFSGGLGLTKKAPDSYFAIGASFRFKTNKD